MISNQKIISDTTHKKQLKTDDRISIYNYSLADTSRNSIDTSVSYLHRNVLHNQWLVDIGNFASAAHSLQFQIDQNPSMKLGVTAWNYLLFTWDKTQFFNTTRAFSSVYYQMGSKKEQMLSVLFTQNITPTWNISAAYRKISAPGFYKLQRTNHDNVYFNTHYLSKNQHYDVKAGFYYNKIQQAENGGIESEDYLSNPIFSDRRLIPVAFQAVSQNISTVNNQFKTSSIHFQHQYFIGKSDSLFNIDSTRKVYHFKPLIGVKHHLYYENNRLLYKDLAPDSLTYVYYPQGLTTSNDSLYSNNQFQEIGNTFSLTGDVRINQKVMQAEAGYGFEFDQYNTLDSTLHTMNNFLFAKLSKPKQSDREWIYNANFKSYFTGYAIGNTLLEAQFGRSISEKLGLVRVSFMQVIQNAPFLYLHYANNYYTETNSFSKQTITDFSLNYTNQQFYFDVTIHYDLLGNYIYRDENLNANQFNQMIPIAQLELNKAFHYRKFIFNNQFLFQQVQLTASNPLHLPFYASRHRLAYENKILKSKLIIATGLDIRYNTPYFANNYNATFSYFTPQSNYKISNIPQIAYFFNFRIKTFKASLAFDEIQQLFSKNHINYQFYPASNFGIRFSLNWNFIN